jgi:hypothetical protein
MLHLRQRIWLAEARAHGLDELVHVRAQSVRTAPTVYLPLVLACFIFALQRRRRGWRQQHRRRCGRRLPARRLSPVRLREDARRALRCVRTHEYPAVATRRYQ